MHAVVALIFCIFLVVFLLQGRTVGLVLAPFALIEAGVAFHYLNGLIKSKSA